MTPSTTIALSPKACTAHDTFVLALGSAAAHQAVSDLGTGDEREGWERVAAQCAGPYTPMRSCHRFYNDAGAYEASGPAWQAAWAKVAAAMDAYLVPPEPENGWSPASAHGGPTQWWPSPDEVGAEAMARGAGVPAYVVRTVADGRREYGGRHGPAATPWRPGTEQCAADLAARAAG